MPPPLNDPNALKGIFNSLSEDYLQQLTYVLELDDKLISREDHINTLYQVAELAKTDLVIRAKLGKAIERIVPPSTLDALEKITSLHGSVVQLQQKIEGLTDRDIPKQNIEQGIEQISKSVAEIVVQTQELTAKVLLPPPESMNIQLVPSHRLEQLEEYSGDQNLFYALAGLLLGTALGMLVNWVTLETSIHITNSAKALCTALLVMGVLTGAWGISLRMRAKRAKGKLLRSVEQKS
jgi:hypothetical protein